MADEETTVVETGEGAITPAEPRPHDAAPPVPPATERFAAPEHVSAVTLSTGPNAVVDGIVELLAPVAEGDRHGLLANGFLPL